MTWPPKGQTALTLPESTVAEEDAIREAGSIRNNHLVPPSPWVDEIERLRKPRLVRHPNGNIIRVTGPLKPGFVEVESTGGLTREELEQRLLEDSSLPGRFTAETPKAFHSDDAEGDLTVALAVGSPPAPVDTRVTKPLPRGPK